MPIQRCRFFWRCEDFSHRCTGVSKVPEVRLHRIRELHLRLFWRSWLQPTLQKICEPCWHLQEVRRCMVICRVLSMEIYFSKSRRLLFVVFSYVKYDGPRRVYLYAPFCFHTLAPRMATMIPVLVSPIFIVDVSTAEIRASFVLGFSGSGWRFSCSVIEVSYIPFC